MKYIIANIEVKDDCTSSYTSQWQFHVSDESEIQEIVEKHFQRILELKNMKYLKKEILSISDEENLEYNTMSIDGPKFKHQI